MLPSDDNIRLMLRELEMLGRGLSVWEEEFLESITDRWDRTGALTPKQKATLTHIYEARVK